VRQLLTMPPRHQENTDNWYIPHIADLSSVAFMDPHVAVTMAETEEAIGNMVRTAITAREVFIEIIRDMIAMIMVFSVCCAAVSKTWLDSMLWVGLALLGNKVGHLMGPPKGRD